MGFYYSLCSMSVFVCMQLSVTICLIAQLFASIMVWSSKLNSILYVCISDKVYLAGGNKILP